MAGDTVGKIYYSDNLTVLRSLKDNSIDLIYIDPPFNTGKKQSRTQIRTVKSENGDRVGFKGNNYATIAIGTKEYNDDFGEKFTLDFIKPRLLEAYRVLADHGSLYFHIDYREVHYCKILLDKIFGRKCFLNEIIWAYDYGAKPKTRWPAKHDNILVYVKNPSKYIFNSEAIDREQYMAPGLVGPEKAKRGKLPTDTWWHTIVGTNGKERTGYPTQKPLGIINRIIQASSLPGQTVLDFFAGSGTVGESCLKLGRNFILVDSNQVSLEVMAKRFPKTAKIEWVNFNPIPYQLEEKEIIPLNDKFSTDNFDFLVSLSKPIRSEIEDPTDAWETSPFNWVIDLSAAKKGKFGKNLIISWLTSKGLPLEYDKDIRINFVINGNKIAIKFSTLWKNGCYTFQQIRSEGYDLLICFGLSPTKANCWVVDKNLAINNSKPQHKSAKDAEYWFSINAENPPEWLKECGGSLDEAFSILKNLPIK
jgi:site-specific DNA-methyltransferase (adenine-specific)